MCYIREVNKFIRIYILIVIGCCLLLPSCSEVENNDPPTVTTSEFGSITATTATLNGTVESGTPIQLRGICWNVNSNPTLDNFSTHEEGGIGAFESELTRLNPHTTYYARAYAITALDTIYGNEITLETTPISSSISIYSDKEEYTLCESIVITVHNTSLKDTIQYTACNGAFMTGDSYINSGNTWYLYNGELCFLEDIEIWQILPQQKLFDSFDETTSGGCRPEPGTYRTQIEFFTGPLTNEIIYSNAMLIAE